MMQAKNEVKMAVAHVKVYEGERREQEVCVDLANSVQQDIRANASPQLQTTNLFTHSAAAAPPSSMDLATALQAFQNSVSLSRLPVPEPSEFSGNPLHFTEWKNAFTALIEQNQQTNCFI